MFSSNRFANWLLSLVFVVASGCSTTGLGCDCVGMTPLSDLGLQVPPDQTVEGGAQVRVTPAGFDKLTEVVPAVFQDVLGDGMCIPDGDQSVELLTFEIASLSWCYQNQGSCTPGCNVQFEDIRTNFSAPNDQVLRVDASIDVKATVPVNVYLLIIIDMDCTINIDAQDVHIIADIAFGIDNATGELTLHLDQIHELDLSGITTDIQGCGIINEVDNFLNIMFDILSTPIAGFIINLLTPVIDDLVQGFLPDPLGFEHLLDLGDMIGTISPGTRATMETRIVPGGYVQLYGGGMSLGIITGLNSDEDLSTRSSSLDNEAAYCVPPMLAPDFTQPPPGLPQVTRSALGGNVFSLAPAGAFLGQPDPAAEIAIGLSETTLDLGGHHAVTSGALCVGVGTSMIEQLNLGLVGILVPSLAELGSEDGTDPLLLVTRPQKPIDFSIGEGTEDDPSLTIHLEDFEVDFYAFIYERYIRGFSIGLTMDIGINLEFTEDDEGNPAILPTLTGMDTNSIELTVLNSEFLRESTDTLEGVLPAIFDMALPMLTDSLGAITLPDFAGYTLTNLQTQKVVTTEDEFLALFATLGAVNSTKLAGKYPSVARVLDAHRIAPPALPTTRPRARLISLTTPEPEAFRRGYANLPDGERVVAMIEADRVDDLGRELEWTWNLNGGLWRPFVKPDLSGVIVIEDLAYGFALQGRHTIELKSRAVGDYRTLDREPTVIPVVIDSVPPRIHAHRAHLDGTQLVVPANDLISPDEALGFALGSTADLQPVTAWSTGPIDFEHALRTAGPDKQLVVWARDELGNQSSATVDLGPIVSFHGQTDADSTCGSCASGGDAASLGGLALIAGLSFLLLGFRRPRSTLARLRASRVALRVVVFLPYVGAAIAVAAFPACNCGGDPQGDLYCEIDEDCAEFCPEGTIPICFENQCVCADDVPMGRIGQDSQLDLSSGGAAWVSAYNSTHGDLMVARWPGDGRITNDAWEFIDGVPEGPVILPTSEIRNGIFDPGDDVGRYTDIAVTPDDTVMISYFDKTNNALKFISNAGGVWSSHVVDDGDAHPDPELGYEIAGQYSSITVRTDDGRPGIAYFAQINEVTNMRTEVRYAAANSPTPTGPQDWSIWIVDDLALPVDSEITDVYPIPMGTGLFIESARLSDQTPVLVYYDRYNWALMLARFDSLAGTFMEPEVLDGHRDITHVDVGWYPCVAVDSNDALHITYVDPTNDDLLYINTVDNVPEVVDDGYRIVGTTEEGLPKPEYHFIGDDSSVVMTTLGPVVAYQDTTTHELLLAYKNSNGNWEHETVAGNEEPFAGGYGFYASADWDGAQVVISNWVVNQPDNAVWVEIFRKTIVVE